ncbi:3-dehydroquinate dehydratase (plasmid) [Ketogulonicigenium robustum]|uniref:3-dehydroquinate dehydratase n=1 Tax=Ketogulonicigenium robustum TaxID=92947 RepID=A0A1W6P3D5_9RHOB|nr:DUF2478 domain-containing protein [Ketogulonicigenium robustum]ARO15923.1 3-dehydroquinate dehydratase [Ketogulonicigenium robustum]
MRLGYIPLEDEAGLRSAIAQLGSDIAIVGALSAPDTPAAGQRPRIVITLLPTGDTRVISADLGPGSTGCRLDVAALDSAIMEVESAMSALPDGTGLLVVNKFGKQEAAGLGFVPTIANALARDIPVLVAVAPDWQAAFDAFADGSAARLQADTVSLRAWMG